MASSRVMSRLCSRIQPLALKLNKKASFSASDISLIKSTSQSQTSSSAKRISRMSRLPVELSSLVSMMPLHSAIASSRLRSSLSIDSQTWGIIPQGISMPL